MSRGEYYFSRGIVEGLGRVFFLKVLQEAPPQSPPRRLLGSFVDQINYGFLGTKEAPGMEHSWEPEYFLRCAGALPGWETRELVLETALANFTRSYKVETKAGADARAAFPGAPVSVGIEVDYERLKTVTVTMGAGSRKLYIPREFVPAAYKAFRKNAEAYDDILASSKHMLVNQIVLVRNLTLKVDSRADFSTDFQAKATHVNDLGGGIRYSRKSERSYEIEVSDGKEYLFAIGGIEADKHWSRK